MLQSRPKNVLLFTCVGFLFGVGLNLFINLIIWYLLFSTVILIVLWVKKIRFLLLILLGFWFGSIYTNFFSDNLIKEINYTQKSNYSIEIIKPAWESKYGYAIAKLPNKRLVQVKDLANKPAGTILSGDGTIEAIKSGEDFDTRSYWLSKGVVGRLKWEDQPITTGFKASFFSTIENIRHKLLDTIYFTIKSPYNQLASGLIMGFRADFGPQFDDNMKNTGTTHIVAVSGYNISIVVAIFFFGLLFLGLKRTYFLTIIFILLFICLVGFDPSVIRAAFLAFMVIGAKVLGRPIKFGYLLILIASGMVLYNPLILLFNPSFQLSFSAVLGLVYLQPIIEKNRIFLKFPQFIKESLGATISAQLAVAPLLLSIFGGISLISLLANVLILPLVPIAMLFISFVLFASLINIELGKFIGMGVELLLIWMVNVINYLGAHFSLTTYNWNLWLSIIYYVILLVIVRINAKYEKDI